MLGPQISALRFLGKRGSIERDMPVGANPAAYTGNRGQVGQPMRPQDPNFPPEIPPIPPPRNTGRVGQGDGDGPASPSLDTRAEAGGESVTPQTVVGDVAGLGRQDLAGEDAPAEPVVAVVKLSEGQSPSGQAADASPYSTASNNGRAALDPAPLDRQRLRRSGRSAAGTDPRAQPTDIDRRQMP
jgi:hypothetical protein